MLILNDRYDAHPVSGRVLIQDVEHGGLVVSESATDLLLLEIIRLLQIKKTNNDKGGI